MSIKTIPKCILYTIPQAFDEALLELTDNILGEEIKMSKK